MDQLLQDLGINWRVLLVQVGVFVFTFFVLSRLLFGRVLSFMQSREREAEDATSKVRADRAEMERLAKEYEAHLARIEKEAYDRLQGILKQAVEARGTLLAEAQRQAQEEVKAALEAIAREKQSAMASLRSEVVALTREAVERVVAVPVEPSALDAAVRQSVQETGR